MRGALIVNGAGVVRGRFASVDGDITFAGAARVTVRTFKGTITLARQSP